MSSAGTSLNESTKPRGTGIKAASQSPFLIIIFLFGLVIFILKVKLLLRLSDSTTPLIDCNPSIK